MLILFFFKTFAIGLSSLLLTKQKGSAFYFSTFIIFSIVALFSIWKAFDCKKYHNIVKTVYKIINKTWIELLLNSVTYWESRPEKRNYRSSHPEVFLGKGVLEICSKFTGEHPYRSVISVKLQRNFIEVTLRHRCSPVNLLHIFRTPFFKNTSGWLLL